MRQDVNRCNLDASELATSESYGLNIMTHAMVEMMKGPITQRLRPLQKSRSNARASQRLRRWGFACETSPEWGPGSFQVATTPSHLAVPGSGHSPVAPWRHEKVFKLSLRRRRSETFVPPQAPSRQAGAYSCTATHVPLVAR